MSRSYPHRWQRTASGTNRCRHCRIERRLVADKGRGLRVLEFRVKGGEWVSALKSPACPRHEVAVDLEWAEAA